jgi:uncharacterized protein (TIGR03435 family)
MKPLVVGLFLVLTAFGQPSPQGFDVVSIKPSDPSVQGTNIGISPGGSFEARGVTLKMLISQAYDVRDFQISGAPGWVETERYDIITKDAVKGPSEEDLGKMTDAGRDEFRDRILGKLRALMADRFALKVHKETKDLTVYALMVAKSGSKLGAAPDDGTHGSSLNSSRANDGKTLMTGKNLPLSSLIRFLSGQVGRPIIDKTGLTGKYNFTMTYSPDLNRPPDITEGHSGLIETSGPSIFTALQEQLGLKLDSQKAPVEILVIDSVQKASDN